MRTLRFGRTGRAFAGACLPLLLLIAPAGALANPLAAQLRVEGAGRTLDRGTTYLTDTARIQTDTRPECGGSGKTVTMAGPTALGIVHYGLGARRGLRPLGVSDKFSFGLLVCGIGPFITDGEGKFWLYKVNHMSPSVGGDQYRLAAGDQVLWYFQDGKAGINTGDELVLESPARVQLGQQFEVTVYAYSEDGRRAPVPGASVSGGTTQVTGLDGKARFVVNRKGTTTLRATRGNDIPSAPVGVCVDERLSACPAVGGQVIMGTNDADRIVGTLGADEVHARAGNDRIGVRGGGHDNVRCGKGRDTVFADRGDRVARECERVFRRRQARR